MGVNYNPTDPVAGASRATKEVELWTDLGDTLPDINTRITATEAHLADTTDAHDASAVSVLDAGAYFAGTDVEAVLQELGAGGGGGGAIRVEDEGVSTVTAATALNFAGAGVTVTDAGSNEALVTIPGGSGTFSGAFVSNSGTQAIPTGAFTALTFDTEAVDTDSYHSTASNTDRLVAPSTGYYLIVAHSLMALSNLGNIRYIEVQKNGTTRLAIANYPFTSASGLDTALEISVPAVLTAADYVTIRVFQDTGSSRNASSAHAQIIKLG